MGSRYYIVKMTSHTSKLAGVNKKEKTSWVESSSVKRKDLGADPGALGRLNQKLPAVLALYLPPPFYSLGDNLYISPPKRHVGNRQES